MNRGRRLGMLLLWPLAALAGPAERLDDSASPRQRVVAQVEWLEPEPWGAAGDEERLNALVARAPGVEVRLDTSRYVGAQARIYLRLPQTGRGQLDARPVRLSWQARGTFQGGRAESGQRGLLYDGEIGAAQLADILDLSFEVDARSYDESLNLDLSYEIETR